MECRCGHLVDALDHPCHGRAYTCGDPARQRFYSPKAVALSSVQMKLQVHETWACDECWEQLSATQPAAAPVTVWIGLAP